MTEEQADRIIKLLEGIDGNTGSIHSNINYTTNDLDNVFGILSEISNKLDKIANLLESA